MQRRLFLAGILLLTAFVSGRRCQLLAADMQYEFVLEWGQRGEGPGEFHSPIGLAFNSHQVLFVTDLNNARIQKFSTDGVYLGEFPLPRDNPERKSTMIGGIAIGPDDLIYLTFMVGHKVGVYRETGELVREWGTKGQDAGQFQQPGGILFTPDGQLLIADQCNHRIQRLTTAGDFLQQWGGYGRGDGEFGPPESAGSRFGGPHFIALDRQARCYATAGAAGLVYQFSPQGKFLQRWGNKSDEPGGFGSYSFNEKSPTLGPIGIAVDPYDRILVSSLNDRVQYFDPDGTFLFGIEGTDKPEGQLLHPHGMVFDKRGYLYIADAGNQRIVKFRVPPPIEHR